MSNQYEGKNGWTRILFTALFWLTFYFSQFFIALVVVAQCAFTLITGTPNRQLLTFGENLSRYVQEVLRYITFNTEQRPFPFTDFPKSDIVIKAKIS